MTVTLTIKTEPASKANSRKLVYFGKRPAFIKSDKARVYEAMAQAQIPERCRVMMEGPVRVTMHIYYRTERPDLDESVILDVLQARYRKIGEQRFLVRSGVYVNDRQVREKCIFHHIDKLNPRAEIIVESLK
jgi:Holliday junction resolvase RusA-like endonuclease